MSFPFGETVTILTRTAGSADRYDEPTYTWPMPGTSVSGCAFDPGDSTESTIPWRQSVNTQPTLYVPAGTAVTSVDRVIVRGDTYDVDGEPADYTNPFTGWHPGIVVKLTRTEG